MNQIKLRNNQKLMFFLIFFSLVTTLILSITQKTKEEINFQNNLINTINSQLITLIIYNKQSIKNNEYILQAYNQVLKEEGINYLNISDIDFIKIYNKIDKNKVLAIIFPDNINRYLNPEIYFNIKDYLYNSGNIFISYDVGTRNLNETYKEKAIFTDLLGINYITYNINKENSFLFEEIQIIDPEFINYPKNMLSKDNLIIQTYKYGPKKYYISKVQILNNDNFNNDNIKIIATSNKSKIPFILLKEINGGNIYYVNTPLGYLKGHSDDKILRLNLKTFLNKVVKIPYLSKLPNNKPVIILNYHVDSNADWKSIEYMYSNNLLRKRIKASFHITAGDFRDKEGDNLGFDAQNRGKKYVELLKDFGEIGSHGGWAHNYFSYYILYHPNDPNLYDFIKKYIKKNNEVLESVVGYKIVEYSAPNGVYPQPLNTKILEELGMICYYYTGDMGSCPNLTFYNSKEVSDKVLAFPVFAYRNLVSLGEMKKNNISKSEVLDFLIYIINYIIQSENVILYYTHPYDIFNYPDEFKKFIDYIEYQVNMGNIQTLTMKEYTEFFFNLLDTKYIFNIENNRIFLEIENTNSLRDLAFVIPIKFVSLEFINKNKKYLNKRNVKIIKKGDKYILIFDSDFKYQKLILKN